MIKKPLIHVFNVTDKLWQQFQVL